MYASRRACKLVSSLMLSLQCGDGVGKQKRPQNSIWTIIFNNVSLKHTVNSGQH